MVRSVALTQLSTETVKGWRRCGRQAGFTAEEGIDVDVCVPVRDSVLCAHVCVCGFCVLRGKERDCCIVCLCVLSVGCVECAADISRSETSTVYFKEERQN